jgi:hypothetical protein
MPVDVALEICSNGREGKGREGKGREGKGMRAVG